MSRELRSIHVVSSIDEEAAGTSYAVVRLCRELLACGESLSLVTLGGGRPEIPFLETYPEHSVIGKLGFSPQMRERLARAAEDCDILHNNGLWMMPNVYPGRVVRRGPCRLVASPHGMLSPWALNHSAWKKRIFWALAQGPALRRASCFHATAYSEYEEIRSAGFDKQPVCVIPNGIDVQEMKPKPVTQRRILLFLGRIHADKGVDILLHAWAALGRKFPEWELHIAGPDNKGYLTKMRILAKELRLKRVLFCGPLYGKAKQAAYREAELFVLPTHTENFGMTVAESLAAGTPVIVSKGAPWSGLEEHSAGWWIDVGVDSLVACLEEAMPRSQDELMIMGQFGRDWMIRDYSWSRIGQMMHLTYKWLISGGETPAWVRLD